jgi:thiol:disulfide interchange protein DsbD
MKSIIIAATATSALGFAAQPGLAHADPVRDGHVQVELISESSSITPGQPFWVGLRLQMDDGWHVNWRNPGDAGLPPAIQWTLPEGYKAGDIQWPFPERIVTGTLAIFGYERQALLLVQLTPPSEPLPDGAVITARADWVACGDVCVPGGANLSLDLPVSSEPARPDHGREDVFAKAKLKLPVEQSDFSVNVDVQTESLVLTLTPPESWSGKPGDIHFFPYATDLISNAAPQKLQRQGRSYILIVPRARNNTKLPDRLAGIVVSSIGWHGPGPERAIAFDVATSKPKEPVEKIQDRTANGR